MVILPGENNSTESLPVMPKKVEDTNRALLVVYIFRIVLVSCSVKFNLLYFCEMLLYGNSIGIYFLILIPK